MRVAVLTNNLIPYPTGFGSAIHVYSIIETLVRRNHQVDLCCYAFNPSLDKAPWSGGDQQAAIKNLGRMGVSVHLIPAYPQKPLSLTRRRIDLATRALVPNMNSAYRGPEYAAELARLIDDSRANALLAWTVDAVAATTRLISKIPRIASVVDLDHLARRHQRSCRLTPTWKAKLYKLADATADRCLPSLTVSLLKDCDAVFGHAAHHCEWLRQNGISHAQYLPVAVLDQIGSSWRTAQREKFETRRVPRILMLGNVNGVATLPGLYLVAKDTVPLLEKEFGPDGFELHIIGSGILRSDLAAAFHRPSVKVRGYVQNIDQELLGCDVLLVPTPIDLGFRTRIAEGFSFGCCVVAHRSNARGMPELIDGYNVVLADSGIDLGKAVARCLRSRELRSQLGTAARMTFEKYLEGSAVCDQMVNTLESLVQH